MKCLQLFREKKWDKSQYSPVDGLTDIIDKKRQMLALGNESRLKLFVFATFLQRPSKSRGGTDRGTKLNKGRPREG